MMYVVARSGLSGRPTCQHILSEGGWSRWDDKTLCGFDLTYSSRQFMENPIEVILCITCQRVQESKESKDYIF